MKESLYEGREQSWVKHQILERYLLRFALIIGRRWQSITYVDCFSGPWKSKSESYEDTSFAIAIRQLRTARVELEKQGFKIELRAFFIEKNKKAFTELKSYVDSIDDIDIEIRNKPLEDSIDEILAFQKSSNSQSFPFIFIDPKGWTGYALDKIRPLLELKPCEVLINFMTQHVVRFIECEASHQSFQRLFGSSDFAEELKDKQREDRVDEIVFRYRDVVAEAGNFQFPGVAGILKPAEDRSHFHLIYLSRKPQGLQVFKEAEEKSMKEMETSRARLETDNREKRTGQKELFSHEEAPDSAYYRDLRTRYLQQARSRTDELLRTKQNVRYDEVWLLWLQYPLIWEKDLKQWIRESNSISVEGLAPRSRVPKRGENHFLSCVNRKRE